MAKTKNSRTARKWLRFILEIYFTGFILFYRFSAAQWPVSVNEGKGVAGVTIVELLLLLTILDRVAFFLGTGVAFVKTTTGGVAFLIFYSMNYYTLVTRCHGLHFERDFSHLDKSRKLFLVFSCILLIGTIIVLFLQAANTHRRLIGAPGLWETSARQSH